MNRKGQAMMTADQINRGVGKKRRGTRLRLRPIDIRGFLGTGMTVIGEQMQVDGQFYVDDCSLWRGADVEVPH